MVAHDHDRRTDWLERVLDRFDCQHTFEELNTYGDLAARVQVRICTRCGKTTRETIR